LYDAMRSGVNLTSGILYYRCTLDARRWRGSLFSHRKFVWREVPPHLFRFYCADRKEPRNSSLWH